MTLHQLLDRSCIRCGCAMFSQRSQRESPDQVAAWKTAGARRVGGRGLCSACLVWARKHGVADSYSTIGHQTTLGRPCPRCGIQHHTSGALCTDCQAVVADLNETARWVS